MGTNRRKRSASSKISRGAASKLLSRARTLALDEQSNSQEEAFQLLKAAATGGNAEANYALGTWFLFGRHVKKDLLVAARYLSKAAAAGFPAAMFDLAILFEKGTGVRMNKSKAFNLYLRAAAAGDKDSVHSVGRCLYHGIGAPKNRLLSSLILDYAETLDKPKEEGPGSPGL